MSDERMDRRLTQAGAQWRDGIRPAPPVDVAALDAGRFRWVVPVAAAAAVVAAIGIGVRVLPSGDSESGPIVESPTTTPPTSGDLVPWADLPPTRAEEPTEVVPPRRDPARLRACGADDLDVDRFVEGAAGTMYLELTLALATDDACHVTGFPDVTLLDHGSVVPVEVTHARVGSQEPVAVVPGSPATLMIGWSVSHSCAAVDNDQVRVAFPDGSALTVPGFGRTSCNPGEADLQGVSVAPFEGRLQGGEPRVVGLWRSISVTDVAPLDLHGSPGDLLSFEISLVSTTDVTLDPCPDYTIDTNTGGGPDSEQRLGLNCADIPYRDEEGRPMLPADTPVTFEMRVEVPETYAPKLVWQLETGYGSSVVVGGTITPD
jgi:hypothetical protein